MAALGLVSRVLPVHTAVRNCTRDEGGPFEVGNQVLTLKAENTKTDEYRIVPVHNHLVEQGFLDYVESRPAAVLTVTFRHRPIRSSRVATLAFQENVVLAPGNVFSVSQSAPDLMRVKVAQMNDPSNFKVLKKAQADIG